MERMGFTVFAVVSYLLLMSPGLGTANDRLIVKLLRMEEKNFRLKPEDLVLTRSTGPGFIDDLAKLNLKEVLMEEVWRALLVADSPKKMSKSDWEPFEKIIGTLPQHVIYELNISDSSVLEYFGKLEALNFRQLAVFGDRLKHTFGMQVLGDEEVILKLGNLLCGFTEEDLKKISPGTFRSLLNHELFKGISGCGTKQLRGLLQVAFKYTAVGPPATWSPRTVTSLGYLLAGLSMEEILQIRDGSCKGIEPEIISAVPENVLLVSNMRPKQIASLERTTRLAWRRKTRNMNYLLSGADSIFRLGLFLIPTLFQPVQFFLVL